MSDATLVRMRLEGGIWEGLLTGRFPTQPRLRLWHRDELVGEPETTQVHDEGRGVGRWQVRVRLPAERISDGVQTFVFEDVVTGEALARETIFVGEAVSDDIRAEVEMLRAELDLLKRAFRNHCAEDR